MATKSTTRILAHGIGGGWELRHEGCAPKCCEAKAKGLPPARCLFCGEAERAFRFVLRDGRIWDACGPCARGPCADTLNGARDECGGCEAPLCDPPAPMDFDRSATCESCADAIAFAEHRAADPHCTCNDCSDVHFAECSCGSTIDVVDGAPICPVHDPQSDDE